MRVVNFMRCNDYILFLYMGDGVSARGMKANMSVDKYLQEQVSACARLKVVYGWYVLYMGYFRKHTYITTLKHAG